MNWIDLLLMIEKKIRYAKTNNKYKKTFDENRDSSHIMNLDKNSLYGKAVLERLPVNELEWDEITKFTGAFIKKLESGKMSRF